MKYLKCGLTVLAVFVSAACAASGDTRNPRGSVIGAPTVVGTRTAAQLDALSAKFGIQALAGTAKCNVTVAQINYQTAGARPGQVTNASAAILIPGGANCQGPFPLVAYGRGTNVFKTHAMADPQDPETIHLMAFFAAQGYAVVASDFLGYALSSYPYHPYAHADSEASSIIDSIRAARQAAASLGLTLNGKIMVTGYSQGGHASMAAQRAIERENAGEMSLVAAAHLAGPYNISAAMLDAVVNGMYGVQLFTPFEITAWQKVYGNVYDRVTDVFNSPYDGYMETLFPTLLAPADLASRLATGTPAEARDKTFKPAYLADLAANPNNGAIVAARKQDLLGWDPKAPTVLCGGLNDPTVKFSVNAQTAYDDFRSRGGANVALVDVDAEIRQAYGDNDPVTYQNSYHGSYELPLCFQAAKALFDRYK